MNERLMAVLCGRVFKHTQRNENIGFSVDILYKKRKKAYESLIRCGSK